MEAIQNKIKQFALQIVAVLLLLQLVVGSFVDLWLGGLVFGIVYLILKVK